MMSIDEYEKITPPARHVTAAELACWEQLATLEVPHIRLGHTDWPMMVRSLVAEVRRLSVLVDELERDNNPPVFSVVRS
jgi:hypothetical protein